MAAKHFKRFDTQEGPANFDFWRRLATPPRLGADMPGSVLLLRPDAMGDFVLFARHLKGYCLMFPQAQIDILAGSAACCLAEGTGLFEQTIPWNREMYEKREAYWRDMLLNLAKRCYDLVIYPCYSREANGDEMAAVIPARQRWAVKGDDSNIDYATLHYNRRFYSRIVEIPAADRHESEQNDLIYKAFSGGRVSMTGAGLTVPMPKDEEPAKRMLKEIPGPFVLIVPGARKGFRCWPFNRFLETVNLILQYTTASVVIGGDIAEAEICERLKTACLLPQRVFSIAGKVDIRGFVSVLFRALMFIGNESGPAHLAGALGVPAWVIMGGGHYSRFLPDPEIPTTRIVTRRMDCFGCNWHCRQAEFRCITEAVLPMEQILAEINTNQQKQATYRRTA